MASLLYVCPQCDQVSDYLPFDPETLSSYCPVCLAPAEEQEVEIVDDIDRQSRTS